MRHILIAIVAIAVAAACQARTITVDDNSPADFTTIQSAINDANDGDTIIVQPGRYYGNGNRDIRFSGKAITVRSIDPCNPNIVSATTVVCGGSASQPYRGFIFDNNEGPNSVLAGLTVTGGYSAPNQPLVYGPIEKYSGGGIFCKNSSPTITHCRITGNTVGGSNASGGGIFYWGGRPTISQCIITNNNSNTYGGWSSSQSVGGGGIYGDGEGTIIDCVITNNTTSESGGGILCSESTVINCTVANNSAYDSGGVSCFNSTVINCAIKNNSASLGAGGIDCSDSRILNCTIEENKVIMKVTFPAVGNGSSPARGGGVVCDGNFIIDNCVIRKNSATAGGILRQGDKAQYAKGGGIYAWTNNPSSVGTITNSIISENLAQGGTGLVPGSGPIVKIVLGAGGDGMGGGIYCNDPCGEVKIVNCLIVANKSNYGRCFYPGYYPDGNAYGGGAYCNDVTFTACTFVANEAANGKGAGIYGSSNINSCILWDVNDQNSPPVTEVSGGTIIRYSNIHNGYAGEGNIDVDPCFVQPGYWVEGNIPPLPCPWCYPPPREPNIWIEGDYRLLSDSSCIDLGDPNYVAGPNETDLDGNRRVVAGRIDMGAYEYPNNLPVANAGPNQAVYARKIDGIAEVNLDGSGSYDADGDALTYLWKWSIDGNDYNTTGVNPTIELPVGQYTIELVVNDGREDSEPNQVVITIYEYPNTAPVADAGANQVVYAWIDGIAEVNLDGSGSYDPDGDELIYSWKWTIDGNDYNTTGVKPTIELPVGQSTLELVVNDGREDSEPNQVVVTVVEPIKSTLCIVPKIINWRSGQPRILAMLRLPAGIGRKQIDQKQKLLLYPGKIESSFQLVLPCGQRGVEQCRILAYFDKSELMDAVGNAGMVQLEVVGHLKTGQYFFGSDKVGVIKPPRKPVWRWTGY